MIRWLVGTAFIILHLKGLNLGCLIHLSLLFNRAYGQPIPVRQDRPKDLML